jgi:hypothetical protein
MPTLISIAPDPRPVSSESMCAVLQRDIVLAVTMVALAGCAPQDGLRTASKFALPSPKIYWF